MFEVLAEIVLWSIGPRYYGKFQTDDGVIVTKFATVFFLPLFPINSYLIPGERVGASDWKEALIVRPKICRKHLSTYFLSVAIAASAVLIVLLSLVTGSGS